MSISSHNKEYWDSFYKSSQNLNYPSQFAAFAASLVNESDLLLDIGCGNGRDSVFLSQYVNNIVAIDKCDIAVQKINERFDSSNSIAVSHSFGDDDNEALIDKITFQSPKRKVFYSRFFFHSIDEQTQSCVLKFVKSYGKFGDICCFEFRTSGDQYREKIYGNHERRYVDFNQFINELLANGFKIVYKIEGNGMAFFKGEDATVGRIVCELLPND